MQQSAEQLCAEIERPQLMSSKDFAAMKSRWFRPERKEVADPAKFTHWLRVNHYLTDFVVQVLSQGKAEELVLDQYRLRDQLRTGPLAGAYIATDPLERLVLIQVLSASVTGDPARLQRLQQIARQLIALQHPNVCRVLDSGQARGMYYVVREYYDAETLAGLLAQRSKLNYEMATRIFALACEGLGAMHDRQVPGGALTADCLLLTATGKGTKAQRTVRLLLASVRKDVFDSAAIGAQQIGIPEELKLVALPEEQPAGLPTPQDDLFRLGCLFYRTLTGKEPFAADEIPNPRRAAAPLMQVAPEAPAMLAEIVEHMIDADPAKRPANARHVAKSLRVFLKSDEESKEARIEEQVVSPTASAAQMPDFGSAAETQPWEEAEEEEDETPKPRRRRAEAEESVLGRLQTLWDEVRPEPREWAYLACGAVGVIVLILLLEVLMGLRFVNLVCLATGAAISFFVERLLRGREHATA